LALYTLDAQGGPRKRNPGGLFRGTKGCGAEIARGRQPVEQASWKLLAEKISKTGNQMRATKFDRWLWKCAPTHALFFVTADSKGLADRGLAIAHSTDGKPTY